MNDFVYQSGLYGVLRDTYRRDARRLFQAVADHQTARQTGPSIGARFAAAWQAFFAHDSVLAARGGQRA